MSDWRLSLIAHLLVELGSSALYCSSMSEVVAGFDDWLREADQKFLSEYGIDTSDAGIDDDYLRQCFDDGETPEGFVKRIGEKYDLTPRREMLGYY